MWGIFRKETGLMWKAEMFYLPPLCVLLPNKHTCVISEHFLPWCEPVKFPSDFSRVSWGTFISASREAQDKKQTNKRMGLSGRWGVVCWCVVGATVILKVRWWWVTAKIDHPHSLIHVSETYSYWKHIGKTLHAITWWFLSLMII